MASEWLFPTQDEHEESSSKSQNEELFVFGYACKLFRDDEQALTVDEGKYMIPWMGDESLLIDRYDGRGHLYDLRPYDADLRKRQPPPELTEDEKNIEKLCDEERYLELHTDLAQKAMYEEEEWKRYYESLSEGYQAVGFSYDGGYHQQYQEQAVMEEHKPSPDELPYTPPPELQVPPGTHIPSTIKENAIIEKTAKFIAEHGVQMEIVMKTKQANNPKFNFMHFEDSLHPFYKHLVKMIKAKKYIPKSPEKETKEPHNDSAEGDHEEGEHGGYLHPTLMTLNRSSPTPENYKPSKPVVLPKVSVHETSYGQLLQSFAKVNKEVSNKKKIKEEKVEIKQEVVDQNGSQSVPPPPGVEPVQLPEHTSIKQEPEDTNSEHVQSTSPPPQIVPPPPDAQPIIDRMAMYVAKNGAEFAIVVKSKNDPRFQFLEPWHPHYAYYDFKRHLFQEEMDREKEEKEAVERQKEKEKSEQQGKGVKFKLKKSKDQDSSTSLEKKTLFKYDESSDEDSDSTQDKPSKSANVSGSSTPTQALKENKSDNMLEKRLAEQKVRDRLAASAREKLSQADKEMQIKLERKKKAAMFINLLKSKNARETEADANTENKSDNTDKSSSPAKSKESNSSKSKHRDRSRSKSRDRRSRSKRSRSRSRRSRSRSRRSRSRSRRSHSRSRKSSRSRSREKSKKRKRSQTPPSAYAVATRPSGLFPPPPPRYIDSRSRYSRSPSRSSKMSRSRSRGRSSKHRSKSRSPSKSKSKKKKRSKSPKSKKDESSRRKSSSKKKKKKSHSKSKDEKSSKSVNLSVVDEVAESGEDNSRVINLVDEPGDTTMALEEEETRTSTPEPGEIVEGAGTVDVDRFSPKPPDIEESNKYSSPKHSPWKRKRSGSGSSRDSSLSSRSSSSKSRSRSPPARISKSRSPMLGLSNSRSPKLGLSRLSKSRSRSPKALSRSPASSKGFSRGSSPKEVTLHDSREATPTSIRSEDIDGANEDSNMSTSSGPQKNVSSYMLDRVRALIKASKDAVKTEDMFAENSS